MGRKSILTQIEHRLHEKIAFGESRHKAKEELKEREDYKFGDTIDTIHSVETFDNYMDECKKYGKWLTTWGGVSKHADLDKCKDYASKYLDMKIRLYNEHGKGSAWSIKKARSALRKLYGEQIPIREMPKRDKANISRSRDKKNMDRHFSEERNKDLVTISRATGGRRADIEKMSTRDFFEKNSQLWVNIQGSKGGRDRISPVLPQLQDSVREIIKDRQDRGQDKLFDKVHGAADIHSYRREYAQELLRTVQTDRGYRDEILKEYPPRNEPNIKGDTLTTRTGEIETYCRDDIYAVSEALGHNRLEIVTSHYIR